MAERQTSPFITVIFGATGDLTKRKLLPSLFALFKMNLLPDEFQIIAFARRPYDDSGFLETAVEFISEADRDSFRSDFGKHLVYHQGDFASVDSFNGLKTRIREYEDRHKECLSKMYYMAVGPDVLPGVIENIGATGLHIGCGEEGKWTRVIVEKPFGHDLESAQTLNSQLAKFFQEEQIYRIDHYLGKETVQNILAVRFANLFFRPVWNAEYIDSIQISALESLGVEGRGGYYDSAGALRDMIQSHLLQLLALTTMEEPTKYDAQIIREEKNKILRTLRPFDKETIHTDIIRGQYEGFRSEEKIDANSQTETFVAMRSYVDVTNFLNVPIYLRTGKKLSNRATDIHIKFKKAGMVAFSNLFCELRSNVLSIRLQPNEGIHLNVLIKEPGFGVRLQDVDMEYLYSDTFNNLPDAYERLILDCLSGDQSLFTRSDEIESSWRYVTNILDLWKSENIGVIPYQPGTNGPKEADLLTHWI